MNKIIYGTTNPAKVAQVRDVLGPLGFEIKSLADYDEQVTVEEDGQTAEENAQKKAIAYAGAKLFVAFESDNLTTKSRASKLGS